MTDDDRIVLEWLADVRLATGAQLARRLFDAASPMDARARSCRRTLARLEAVRLIERLGRRIGGVRAGSSSIVYGVGRAGQRLLSATIQVPRLGTPSDRFTAHTLAVTELLVRLHEGAVHGAIDMLTAHAEPRAWRSFVGPGGRTATLKPDAFVRLGAGADELLFFVEVDMATESRATLRRKAAAYLAHYASGSEQAAEGTYPRVIWAVPDRRRREQLSRVLSQLPEPSQELFVVWIYDEVLGRLAAEAQT